MSRISGFAFWLAVLVGFSLGSPVRAGDWPQILGPARNGIATDERLPSRLPANGPAVAWERPVGSGFAGVAVRKGTLILFHRDGNSEIVEALETADGSPLWKASFPSSYTPSFVEDDGPRCVPLIQGDSVYVYGAGGNLHALSIETGAKLWSRAAFKEFRAPDGYFGAGSSPILEGDRLIVNVGGSGAGLVAFSLKDGKTLWKSTDEDASYSSPVAVTHAGIRHVIFITRLSTLSIDPANGTVRWQFPFGKRGPTVNAANPVVDGDSVFATASYEVGAVYARFTRDSVKTVWANDDTLSSQYTTPVLHQGFLYGIDGRQDIGIARLRCVEAKTGKVQWTREQFGKATLILADGKLLIVKTDGTLVLAEASPKAWRELGSARILDETTRALPALSNGRLYVRDTRTLKCLDLSDK